MANFQSLDNDEYTDEDRYGVQDVIDEINEPSAPEEKEDEEDLGDLSDVEIRLEEANCLKALLNNSLFEEPLSPIAKRVERRIRAFIHTELKVLLGIKVVKEEVKLFTDNELDVLKALAGKVLSKNPPRSEETPVVVPAKLDPVPVVKKNPSPPPPVKVRKAREPKAKPQDYQSYKAEQESLGFAAAPDSAPQSIKPSKTMEVTLPNGMVVSGLSAQTQVRGTGQGGYPTLSPEQQANFYEQQALTTSPSEGILGVATAAVHRLNALTPEE